MKTPLFARLFLLGSLPLLAWLFYQQHLSLLSAAYLTAALLGSYGLLERYFLSMTLEQLKQTTYALCGAILCFVVASASLHYLSFLFHFAFSPVVDFVILIGCCSFFFLLREQLVRHAQTLRTSTRLLLVTPSALQDPRLYDVAALGLLDNLLCVPTFLVETNKPFCDLRNLDNIKKLQTLSHLRLKLVSVPILATEEATQLIESAEYLGAHLLTSDLLLAELAQARHVKLISLHALSIALKPILPQREAIKVKIQRLGKEADQGIGYLEDGTMVVVNGGGGYLGEFVASYVLSIRQTATGRMMFCNVCDTN